MDNISGTAFAEKLDQKLGKGKGKKAMVAFLEVLKYELAQHNKVSFVDFGSFNINNRPARMGRNPKTGAAIQIEAKNIVKFKPGEGLKSAVN